MKINRKIIGDIFSTSVYLKLNALCCCVRQAKHDIFVDIVFSFKDTIILNSRTFFRRGRSRRNRPRRNRSRRKNVRGGSSSAADSILREVFSGGHFPSEQLRQFAAESARIRADSGGVRRSPPNVRRTFGGVRWKFFLAEVRRIRAEPGGVRAFPRGFARVRRGRSSAVYIAKNGVTFNQRTLN